MKRRYMNVNNLLLTVLNASKATRRFIAPNITEGTFLHCDI